MTLADQTYLLFAGEYFYHYCMNDATDYLGTNEKMTLFTLLSYQLINTTFVNLWKNFDASYRDPFTNEIFLFHKDYHVRCKFNQTLSDGTPNNETPNNEKLNLWYQYLSLR